MKRYLASIFWLIVALVLMAWPAAFLFAGERPTATPTATADQWLSDPEGALASILVLAQTLANSVNTASWSTIIFAVVGSVVAVLRFTPAWGPIAGTAWDWFMATRKDKAIEREMTTQADGFRVLVKTIERLPPNSTLGALRDKLSSKMPEQVKNAVDAYLDTLPPSAPTQVIITQPGPMASSSQV